MCRGSFWSLYISLNRSLDVVFGTHSKWSRTIASETERMRNMSNFPFGFYACAHSNECWAVAVFVLRNSLTTIQKNMNCLLCLVYCGCLKKVLTSCMRTACCGVLWASSYFYFNRFNAFVFVRFISLSLSRALRSPRLLIWIFSVELFRVLFLLLLSTKESPHGTYVACVAAHVRITRSQWMEPASQRWWDLIKNSLSHILIHLIEN